MYAGCVSGALIKNEYMDIINRRGFKNISIRKEKSIVIPDDVLSEYLSEHEKELFKKSGTGIFSITITADK